MRASAGGRTARDAGDGPITLRPGGQPDAPVVAAMHAGLITEGFLSSLGQRFLTRLYARLTRSEGSFLLVAVPASERAEGLAGFIAGSVSVGRLYRDFVMHDGARAAAASPWHLVRAWPRVLETLRHGRSAPTMPGGELLAIAVEPAWRGRGVGLQLVEGFAHELQRRGMASAHVVVGADNAPAIGLYRRAGFAEAHALEMHKGTPSVLMQRPLPGDARSVPRTMP